MFVFVFEDEDEDELRGCWRTLQQPCAQLGFKGATPQFEPSWNPPLPRGMRGAEWFVLVLVLVPRPRTPRFGNRSLQKVFPIDKSGLRGILPQMDADERR